MKSPWLRSARRALVAGAMVALPLWLLHRSGVALPLVLALSALLGVVTWIVPRWGVRLLDEATLLVRSRLWAADSGHFHSFAGVPLRIVDDGRHVWISGDGLQRVLGWREPEDVLAARHASHWQRDAEGTLLLRVDAVLRHLETMPARNELRVQRLRRYLQRDVLYPAQQRRDRR